MSTYQGLVNEGATCYLNSLLQTLYMTPEFRQNVYAYQHDPKKISEKDSIAYQLQRLFVLLQTQNRACYTKSLLKSFQWNSEESFQQHDVQEFCRKLFEAIEKTHKNTGWIKQLFEGSMQSYVDCGQHRSTKSEAYMDIALPIRNQYTKQTYQSIEESLHDYLRPEKLEDRFQCSGCGQRVFVEKGMALEALPPILTLQLNRFELNFQTLQREKINSFFYFPQVLEMHRFVKPHTQIQIKGLPKNLVAKSVTVAKKQTARTANIFDLTAERPRQRKKSDDKVGKKEVVSYFDEQNKDKRSKQMKQISQQDQKLKNLEILASLKQEKGKIDKKMEKIKEKGQNDLDEDMLFGMGLGFITPQDWQTTATPASFQNTGQPTFEKSDTSYEHEEEAFDPKKDYPELTYALYAVLVHSGGSYGGHYFAYVADGSDWYRFDDRTVTKVRREDIRKYGVNSNATFGTNAYLLFYRDVKTFREVKNIEIPAQLLEKVRLDEQKGEEKKETTTEPSNAGSGPSNAGNGRSRRLAEISQGLIVKVFRANKEPLVLHVQDRNEETVNSLREKIGKLCSIAQKAENWRLRRYNNTDDTMYEVYQASESTLEQLGLREQVYLTLQFKQDAQIFQDYNPRKITVKFYLWRQDIGMVVEKKLKPIKIAILDQAPFERLHAAVVAQTHIANPLILRRNFSGSNPINKLELESNRGKKLIDLRFFNNIALYVEEKSESPTTKWALQFQNERYRCLIKFNHPKVSQSKAKESQSQAEESQSQAKESQAKEEEIYFDTRRTLGELKALLSTLVGLPQDNFRIKKGKQATAEMTAYKKKLIDLRFIGNQHLYLEEGKSSKGSIIVKRAEAALLQDRIEFSLFEELQFEIGGDLSTVGDLSKKISASTGIPHQNIRVREFRNFEFKQIFSQQELIQRIRDKSLVWELVEGEVPKGLQIYYRLFDLVNFEFGPLKSLYADAAASYEELALLIEEETGIASNRILAWRPLSNYIEKENMLDVEWREIRYLQATIREEPLLINCDGDILIIKEAEAAYHPPKVKKSPEVKAKNKGEAQLTITVIAENEQPAESKLEQSNAEKPKPAEIKAEEEPNPAELKAQEDSKPAELKAEEEPKPAQLKAEENPYPPKSQL